MEEVESHILKRYDLISKQGKIKIKIKERVRMVSFIKLWIKEVTK
jgi:hypothetical protein